MKKKAFTLFLSFAMVFTMLFANVSSVFAADNDWTYSASGATITATRTMYGRLVTATVTVSAEDVEYDANKHGATVEPDRTWRNNITVPTVAYYKDGVEMSGVPTEVGNYVAKITKAGETAEVSYKITEPWTYTLKNYEAEQDDGTIEFDTIVAERTKDGVLERYELSLKGIIETYDGQRHAASFDPEELAAWESNSELPRISDLGIFVYYQNGNAYKTGAFRDTDALLLSAPKDQGFYEAKFYFNNDITLRYWDEESQSYKNPPNNRIEIEFSIGAANFSGSGSDFTIRNEVTSRWRYSTQDETTLAGEATITINAADVDYDGNEHSATLGGDVEEWVKLAKTLPEIKYFTADGEELTEAPTNAGNYVAKIIWEENVAEKAYTINPKEIVVTPDSISKYVGQTAPKESALTYKVTGLLGKDAAIVEPQLAYSPKCDTSKAGTIAIVASGADYGQNYKVKYVNGKLTVKTPAMPKLMAKVTANSSNNNFKLSWNKYTGASKYVIYASKCVDKGTKKILTVKGTKTSATVKKIGKKIEAYKGYKFYVKAYDKKGKLIAESLLMHSLSRQTQGKAANSIAIKATKKSATLDKGQTVKLGAKVTVYKKMMHLPVSKIGKAIGHAKDAHLRFITSNKYVATVDSKGLVKAKGYGKCTIYICDTNGMWVKVPVTVAPAEAE